MLPIQPEAGKDYICNRADLCTADLCAADPHLLTRDMPISSEKSQFCNHGRLCFAGTCCSYNARIKDAMRICASYLTTKICLPQRWLEIVTEAEVSLVFLVACVLKTDIHDQIFTQFHIELMFNLLPSPASWRCSTGEASPERTHQDVKIE